MTDYASQGKTRTNNVVDLNNCSSHQAYYTALSRSASAAGTLILQGFDAKLITGGASAALRQEFRNLEILDAITLLRFESKLPKSVTGEVRSELVSSYRKWKGTNYVPDTIHPAIRWRKTNPFLEDSIEDVTPAELLGELPNSKQVDVDLTGTNVKKNVDCTAPVGPVQSNDNIYECGAVDASFPPSTPECTKRKFSDDECTLYSSGSSVTVFAPSHDISPPPLKKRRLEFGKASLMSLTALDERDTIPKGLVWQNNSCAYDAFLTVIFNLWAESRTRWSDQFDALNADYMGSLVSNFGLFEGSERGLEKCREILRRRLQRDRPNEFPFGCETSIHTLLHQLLTSPSPVTSSVLVCPAGHRCHTHRSAVLCATCVITVPYDCRCLQDLVRRGESWASSVCRTCGAHHVRRSTFVSLPPLLAFDLGDRPDFDINDQLVVATNTNIAVYALRGVIYYGNRHFTSRFISRYGIVWYHDGLVTGSCLFNEGALESIDNLLSYGGMQATAVVYAKVGE